MMTSQRLILLNIILNIDNPGSLLLLSDEIQWRLLPGLVRRYRDTQIRLYLKTERNCPIWISQTVLESDVLVSWILDSNETVFIQLLFIQIDLF